MQALRELGRLNRKRKSRRTKLRPKYEFYNGMSELKDVKLEVGQVFTSSKVFKEAAKEYAIKCGRVIWFPCNEKGRVKGICKGKNTICPWSIWASKAKLKAGEIIEGNLSTQYAKLWDYAEELKKTNHESTVVIDIELGPADKNKFTRIYICFNACKQGWLHRCIKIIGLDACHVKSYHKAQLMSAIGINADNGYYLIAYVVVEKEWHESWSWFLKLLKEDLNLEDCLGITFMTKDKKVLLSQLVHMAYL
ncbi:hypothetical protein LWI28_027732 [Acer negundo]|uniref:MULE transposase domain-containing protein n=1 Tax=Acer negundo TaxID=4023 RepID=A0AAD5J8N1_ACENE|nr:hypothetical protein LWI28_027732 [Acer negundo]